MTNLVLNPLPKNVFLRKKTKKVISVVIPSRGRTEKLDATLNSIFSLADKSNDNFEIIVKIDFDDHNSIDYIKKWTNDTQNLTFVINTRGKGWLNMVDYVENTIDIAKGDWILNVNDDMVFLTQDWNTLIEKRLKEFKVYFPFVNGYRWAFPIYPKKIKEILGHISPHNQIDTYLVTLSDKLNIYEYIDEVEFYHDIELQDSLHSEKEKLYQYNLTTRNYHYDSPQFKLDLEKLKKYLDGN